MKNEPEALMVQEPIVVENAAIFPTEIDQNPQEVVYKSVQMVTCLCISIFFICIMGFVILLSYTVKI